METIIVSIAGALLGLLWIREKRINGRMLERLKYEENENVYLDKAYKNVFRMWQESRNVNLAPPSQEDLEDLQRVRDKYDRLKSLYFSKMKKLAEQGFIKCDCKNEDVITHRFGNGETVERVKFVAESGLEYTIPVKYPGEPKINRAKLPGVAYGMFPHLRRVPPHNID